MKGFNDNLPSFAVKKRRLIRQIIKHLLTADDVLTVLNPFTTTEVLVTTLHPPGEVRLMADIPVSAAAIRDAVDRAAGHNQTPTAQTSRPS
jgi:hypothetical protein